MGDYSIIGREGPQAARDVPAGVGQDISFRRVVPDDEDFLFDLFASTREEEFWFLEEPQKGDLIKMQFDLQRRQYEAHYPQATNSIILSHGRPVGRMLVNEDEREVALVDIALLTEHRKFGIGSCSLQNLLREAAAAKKAVRLHVLKSNRAQRLYERLGFRQVGEDGMYLEMLCDPGSIVQQRAD